MNFSKSLILFFLSAFSVCSCSKHMQEFDNQPRNIIRISMPAGFDTKVSMGEQNGNTISQVWNSGDRIAVVQGRGTESMKMSVYRLIGDGGTSEGEFEYVEGNADVSAEVDVVYPIEAAYSYSIPHMQNYVEENYDSASVILTHHSENGLGEEDIVLENETALLCLRYIGEQSEKIARIRVKIETAEGQYDTYVLAAKQAVPLSSVPASFYISVPAVSQSSDVVFETILTDGSMMRIESENRIFKAGMVYRFPIVDFEKNADSSDEQDGYDVYLCIGQSNMAGRGEILAEDYGVKDGIYLLDGDGQVVPASIPFNIYSTIRGRTASQRFGLHNVFADEIYAFTGRKILLVVNARGGTSIPSWLKGADPVIRSEARNDEEELWGQEVPGFYDEAVRRTIQSMKHGALKAILWHQGEGDASEYSASLYVDRLKSLVSDLRKDIGVDESVPFVLGEVSPVNSKASIINPYLLKCADVIPNAFCVTSENCDTQSDNVHFTRAGYITLGKRYSEIILDKVYGIKAD